MIGKKHHLFVMLQKVMEWHTLHFDTVAPEFFSPLALSLVFSD